MSQSTLVAIIQGLFQSRTIRGEIKRPRGVVRGLGQSPQKSNRRVYPKAQPPVSCTVILTVTHATTCIASATICVHGWKRVIKRVRRISARHCEHSFSHTDTPSIRVFNLSVWSNLVLKLLDIYTSCLCRRNKLMSIGLCHTSLTNRPRLLL